MEVPAWEPAPAPSLVSKLNYRLLEMDQPALPGNQKSITRKSVSSPLRLDPIGLRQITEKIKTLIPKSSLLGKDSFEKKKKLWIFTTLVLTPPPLKVVKPQFLFFLLHDQKTIMCKIGKILPWKPKKKLWKKSIFSW